MISKNRMEKIVEEYNSIMESSGLEFDTIGTKFSESTEKWTLGDMVCESLYQAELYKEPGSCAYEDYNSDDPDVKSWACKNYKQFMVFVNKYKKYLPEYPCVCNHCSSKG